MSKFKVGDKVVPVKDLTVLCKGGKYIVGSVEGAYDGFIRIEGYSSLFSVNNFELYIEPQQQVDNTAAVVEWLDKLAYVIETDTSVCSRLEINLRNQAILPTDHGDIIGNQNVAEFINNRYSQLNEQANKAKREQLLKDIVSAKEAYEAKVRELELLEGK